LLRRRSSLGEVQYTLSKWKQRVARHQTLKPKMFLHRSSQWALQSLRLSNRDKPGPTIATSIPLPILWLKGTTTITTCQAERS
jgi:hypothetical protein